MKPVVLANPSFSADFVPLEGSRSDYLFDEGRLALCVILRCCTLAPTSL